MSRPDGYRAEQIVFAVMGLNSDEQPHVTMVEHGSDWAFYLVAEDTTSFVREDLSIEWHGTSWEPEGAPTP